MTKYVIPDFKEIKALLKVLDDYCVRNEYTSINEQKRLIEQCKFLMRDLKDYIKARFTECVKIYAGVILRDGFIDFEVDYFG